MRNTIESKKFSRLLQSKNINNYFQAASGIATSSASFGKRAQKHLNFLTSTQQRKLFSPFSSLYSS